MDSGSGIDLARFNRFAVVSAESVDHVAEVGIARREMEGLAYTPACVRHVTSLRTHRCPVM